MKVDWIPIEEQPPHHTMILLWSAESKKAYEGHYNGDTMKFIIPIRYDPAERHWFYLDEKITHWAYKDPQAFIKLMERAHSMEIIGPV